MNSRYWLAKKISLNRGKLLKQILVSWKGNFDVLVSEKKSYFSLSCSSFNFNRNIAPYALASSYTHTPSGQTSKYYQMDRDTAQIFTLFCEIESEEQ